MFLAITNTPRDYAWGSRSAIAELLGRAPSGRPEAELWLGAHPGSPSVVVNPAVVDGADTLADWFAAEPARALGRDRSELPFLLKVLAADEPLSIQAHPTPEQARAGFAAEEAAGVPIDSPTRNYKDPFPKPEIIVALSESFDALCGFRTPAETIVDVDALDAGTGRLAALRGSVATSLESTLAWLFDGSAESRAVVAAVGELGGSVADPSPSVATVVDLAARWPGDPGVVVSLLLNRVTLRRGEALFLPAGNVHAYLGGLGVELMAPSDNVLRGGLTPKHVDVPELLRVLEFEPLPVPRLLPVETAPGVERFEPGGVGFALLRVHAGGAGAVVEIGGPSVLLVTDGEVVVKGQDGSMRLRRGESAFVTPDEVRLAVTGGGQLYVATPA
jgi:mannose-6-phosphate isomerase